MRTRDGDRVVQFAESFCRHTKGSLAGKLIELRPWQKDLLHAIVESGARRGYVQLPRKNSKSLLATILALYCLCADGEPGAEVYCVAGSKDQARIVFDTACQMVRLDPHLARHLTVRQYDILHKASGSRLKVVASDAANLEGLNPSFVVFDEVHVQGSDHRLWDVMSLAMGTRESPMLLGITTPGVRYGTDGRDSLAWTLYDHTKRITSGEVSDPYFFGHVYEAQADADPYSPDTWHAANPALGDFLSVDDMEAAALSTPENEFKTKRLGLWVAGQTAWMPYGSWDACGTPQETIVGTALVLGFDGSFSGDSTALVAATIEPTPYVFVLGLWEKPPNAPATWRVDRADVKATIRQACRDYSVRELVADPALWQSELEELANERIPVVEQPQTPARMVPATQRFYEATTTGTMRHDADPAMSRHVGNAVIKPNGQIAKENRDSGRKIDLAVAGVMAYDRAATLGNAPVREFFVMSA